MFLLGVFVNCHKFFKAVFVTNFYSFIFMKIHVSVIYPFCTLGFIINNQLDYGLKKKLCQVLSTSAMDFAMGCSWPYVNRKSSLPNVMKFVRSNNVLFFGHTITCHAPEESLIFVYSYKVWCLYSTFKVNLTFMVSYDSIVWQLSVYISFFFVRSSFIFT